ncbi:riboflavin synthase [Candidatus Micrarchaeota archaeon]|nr:riboflavin synthase [Candidatus Micrarchaeota archaeon]
MTSKQKINPLIAIIDTTFSRFNMGNAALQELAAFDVRTVRVTVPGIKDLAVECKRQLDDGADIAMALGMVGGAKIDRQCAHEASLGIQMAKMATSKHIIEVFVHENEARNENELSALFDDRTRKHARNAARMLLEPQWFTNRAGLGLRQGRDDVGGLSENQNVNKKRSQTK